MSQSELKANTEPQPCPCGGGGFVPQHRLIRVPGTFRAFVNHLFCMGGCHRDAVGMTEQQAIEAWNATLERDNAA